MFSLQVADVLSDPQLDTWLQHLSARVKQQDWKVQQSCEACLCALLSLPHHLIVAVMNGLLDSRDFKSDGLIMYIQRLPVSLHGELITP